MSHRRGRVQTLSPEDELDNLQQIMDTQPFATTSTSSGAFGFLDTSTTGSSSSKNRTRGPTRNLDLLGMKPGEKKSTQFNTKGQVVYDDNGERLSSYMGTLVRSQHIVPIQVQDWRNVSEDVKEKVWALILEKYEMDEIYKSYILQYCGNLFRSYRNKMKAKHYDPYNTDEERLRHRPPHLSDDEWRWLINFWGTPKAKAQKKEDRTEPNRVEMFVLTHTKKDGTHVDDHSKQIMDQFEQLLSQPERMSSSSSPAASASSIASVASTYVHDIYTQVMGPERHGRVRGYGFGVTPTLVFGRSSMRQSRATLSAQLENAQEMLRVAEQKFTTATETFEEKLVEVQRKTREEVKEEFDGKIMEMQRVQTQLQEQMMQMMQQFQQRQ